MGAILEDSGWKYYAEFVKAYAPNAAGQTINDDPNITTLAIDNVPVFNTIPGLGNASSNQISLPANLQYRLEASADIGSASYGNLALIPFFWRTDSGGSRFGKGRLDMNGSGSLAMEAFAEGRIDTTSIVPVEFRVLKKGSGASASDVTVTSFPGSSYSSSNSTAGLNVRTTIRIYAK